ncbi:RxLR effector protein [Phytophthora megakarya]|uniref:RxLR effector protein n=1 Tax=Phytophthora megakarya TaxID=4795 RepID=A0A225VTA8_9STRA|nr:RxLR effector protein [Phytophthora megakarya]
MSPTLLVSLAFIVLVVLTGDDGCPTGTKLLQSNFPKITKFHATNNAGITVSRLLRRNSEDDKGPTEERAKDLLVPAFETLKSVLMSSKVTPEKLQEWLKNEKPADIVFKRLHLDKHTLRLFDTPLFAAWVNYADTLSIKFPEMSAISTLIRQYGDDALYKLIKEAKTSASTKTLATQLEMKQMQHWLATKKDPDELFRLFKLGMGVSNILEKPEFITWVKYVDDLNAKYPEEPTRIYTTVTKYINDEALFKITNAAKWSTKYKSIGIKVENDWLQAGIESHKIPYQALLDLGLGKSTHNLLELLWLNPPVFQTWIKYMNVFNTMYPEEKTTLMETFTKAFGDVKVTKMLHAGKDQEWWILATQLESVQLQMWLDSGKTTDDVFQLLKLDNKANTYIIRKKNTSQHVGLVYKCFYKGTP